MADEKKPAAKKPAASKPTASKAAAEKKPAASKSTAAKKPAANKPAASKSSTTKSTAAKSTAKSSTTKSSTAKSTAAKKPAASKAAGAKTSTAAKSTASKKPAASKTASATPSKSTAAQKAGSNGSDAGEKVSSLRMHHLRPAEGAHMRKIRVGRGEAGKRGKTAGRGTKGTGARYQVPARFEGGQTPIHMRIPKLRGFRSPFKEVYQVVNLDQIEKLFPKGGKVTKEDLVTKGAVRKNRPVKVLGEGDLNVKITLVDADKISQSAKTKIEAAGGSVNEK